MASLLHACLKYYKIFNDEWSYPQVKDFFMMGSPFPTTFLAIFYLLVIYKIGPTFMKNRKPFNINKLLIFYNIAQIMFNGFLLTMALYHLYIPMRYNLLCQEVEQGDSPLDQFVRRMSWVYFMNKIMDLLDTVFFILKKKTSQITFLHVYHHTGMIFLGYAGVKYVPGGHSILLGTINSFVHMIMYSYYLTSLLRQDNKHSVWWKKHLTQLQMVQFVLVMLHHSSPLLMPNCNYPRFISFTVVVQNVFAMFMFGDFYRKAYLKPKKVE
uniref:Elongation of very long chain fatty acids protein n=1 Tax=Clastoptera arizonana TaxID=38151 RepID=A0A1B6CJX8_9HEMI